MVRFGDSYPHAVRQLSLHNLLTALFVIAALVLHYVLTLWHCLVNILPEHGRPLPPTGDTIRIIFLGGFLSCWQHRQSMLRQCRIEHTVTVAQQCDKSFACLHSLQPAGVVMHHHDDVFRISWQPGRTRPPSYLPGSCLQASCPLVRVFDTSWSRDLLPHDLCQTPVGIVHVFLQHVTPATVTAAQLKMQTRHSLTFAVVIIASNCACGVQDLRESWRCCLLLQS